MSPELRMPPSAMIGTLRRAAASAQSCTAGDHRHADAGDDPRSADGAGTDADLHRVDAELDERLGGVRGRDVAGDDVDVLEGAAEALHDVHHTLRVAVRGIHDEHVHVRGDQRFSALQRVFGNADRRSAAQPPERILGGVRILDRLLNVLDRDQALEPELAIDDEELLDFLLMQDLPGVVERGADRHGDEIVLGHHVADRPIDVGLEAQVAIGQDADEPPLLAPVFGDRDAGNPIAAHQVERLADPRLRTERDRIDDHPALGSLDAIDFGSLLVDRKILVDDAEPTMLGHRDRHLRLSDCVHRRAEQRDVQSDVAGEPGADVDLRRHHRGVPRHEQHVVEGEGGPETKVQRGRGRNLVLRVGHRKLYPARFGAASAGLWVRHQAAAP